MKRPFLAAMPLASFTCAIPAAAQRTWTLVENLRIGAGDEPANFAVVGPIAVTKNGNIFAVDLRPLQIKLFSPTGQFLRAVGRTGGGPGEYNGVTGMTTGPDGNVYVLTPRNARILVYSPDGLLVREISTVFPSSGREWGGTILSDGTILDDILLPPANPQSTTAERARALQVIRPNGTRADTLPFPTCMALRTSDGYVRVPQGRGYMQTRVPYIPVMQTAFAGDDTAWCTPTDSYSLFHFRIGRPDTLHRISRNVPPPPIPDSGRRLMEGLIARAENRANIVVPKALPTIANIRVDASNRLWVRRTATPEHAPSYDLFDAQGRTLGTVSTTLRWHQIPLVIGDNAYGVVIDEDGVNYVVRAVMR